VGPSTLSTVSDIGFPEIPGTLSFSLSEIFKFGHPIIWCYIFLITKVSLDILFCGSDTNYKCERILKSVTLGGDVFDPSGTISGGKQLYFSFLKCAPNEWFSSTLCKTGPIHQRCIYVLNFF
jgi:hypothetical protein